MESSYRSLPFGDDYTPTGSDLDPYHYAQLDYDSESGTDHAQYRQYSSAQGRWMRPDPYSGSYNFSNPQSMNRYSYVLNNPLGFIDPLGLVRLVICYETDDTGNADGSNGVTAGSSWCEIVDDGGGPGGGGGGGGDGGGTGTSAPSKKTCKTGFGVGVTAGADAGLGLAYGAGGNASVGAGGFVGNGLNFGAFASGGVGAGGPGVGVSAPSANLIGRFFAGVGGGAGGGFFMTNASQASQLSGLSGTLNVDLGWLINGSGQLSVGNDAAGNSIWSFSFQMGVGGGFLFHSITNTTSTAGRKGGC